MKLDGILSGIAGSSGDPGAFLKHELEEAISPVTSRIDRLEKRLELISLSLGRIEAGLTAVQPVLDFVKKLPFFK